MGPDGPEDVAGYRQQYGEDEDQFPSAWEVHGWRLVPVPGGYRNAADFAARAEIVRLFPVAPGTGRTPDPESGVTADLSGHRGRGGGRLLDLVVAGGVGIEDLR